MKKFLVALMVIFLTACTLGAASTPRQKVSEFLDKYKNEDNNIISQLEDTIDTEITDDDHKSRYRTLMTNQYKNMEYEIKDEIIEGENAVVEVEVTVYDYASAIKNSNTYLNEHLDEFRRDDKTTINETDDDMDDSDDETTKDKEDDTITTPDTDYDDTKFMDYKLSLMEKVTDKVTYTIEFTLTKVNDEWQLDSLSNSDIEKLHGIYLS